VNRLRSGALVWAAFYLATSFASAQDSAPRSVHVFVALADNQSQGIIPVAAKLGNGEDPEHNLYWGSAYGVKTFFAYSAEWERIACGEKPKAEVLERCVFKHRVANVYLVADAYRGREILQAILDFLSSAAGDGSETVSVPAASGPFKVPVVARILSPILAMPASWIFNCGSFPARKTRHIATPPCWPVPVSSSLPRRCGPRARIRCFGPRG
jgi:hypothetical protein